MLDVLRRGRSVIRKPIVLLEKHALLKRAVAKEFRSAGLTPCKIRHSISQEPLSPSDMILRKEGGKIVALVSDRARLPYLRFLSGRVAAHAHWFSQTTASIREISADLSDGNAPSAATYRFSTTPTVGVAVPDPYFFGTSGYKSIHAYARTTAPEWGARDDDIVWRGALNNPGLFSLDPENASNPAVMQRLRMALACRHLGVDFRFVVVDQQPYNNVLKADGLTAAAMPPTSWGHKKYAIDIDGFSNAWNNFMQRLALGCCVLKVDSQFGFSQWYYHRLTPWEHFVPVKADLSDLAEQLDWLRTHPDRAREIAHNGQAVARAMTLESETQVAVEIIETHEGAS